jgi:hypothetical protein
VRDILDHFNFATKKGLKSNHQSSPHNYDEDI